MTQRERDTIIHLLAGGWVNLKLCRSPIISQWMHVISFTLSFLHVLLCRCCVAACRLAGTVGAIVTCPLEVVKTRLQSSSSQFYPPRMTEVGRTHNTNGQIKAATQRRDLCTSILRKRSQVSVHAPIECNRTRVYYNFIWLFSDFDDFSLWNFFHDAII